MSEPVFVGRAGLARILDCAERTTRGLQAAGEIAPEMIVGGRPLFSVAKARKLKARRDAKRGRPTPDSEAAAA
jgi:hypothetical protein